MKIMYLLFSYTVGGTERLVTDICNEMASQGHEVYLYVVNDLYSEKLLKTLNDRVYVLLQKRKASRENIIMSMWKLALFIKREKIKVVHCNSFDSPELLFLAKMWNPKLKIVYTIHGIKQYCNLGRIRVIYRNIICKFIIAISQSVRDDIIACGAYANKVRIVYNAIDSSKIEERDIRESKLKDKNSIIIGNVARIDLEKKGQDILLHAIALVKIKYPNIFCVFAGADMTENESELGKLKEIVKELDLESNVKFLGNVDNVFEFLSEIDVFVLPSRVEGFGISLIEAMAMGIPCIASDVGGPAEIIGKEERGLLFSVDDARQLAEKIFTMIERYTEQSRVAIQSISYIKKNFDIKNMCEELVNLYG